jgi:hypothetical protein
MRIVNYVPGLQGVAASGIATLNLPVNRRYHSLRVLATNLAGALTDATTIISLIELIVNGTVIRSMTPATAINLANLYGYTLAVGEVPFYFSEPWRNESPGASEATSWDMWGQSTFTMRITFLAPGGGVGVQAVIADFDGKRNTRRDASGAEIPFLAIVKQTDVSIVCGTGLNDITTLPTNWPLLRLLLDVSANAITSVELFGDGNAKIYEGTNAQNDMLLVSQNMDPTQFEFPLVLDYDNRILQGLKTSSMDLRVNASGALTLTAHVHQLVNGYK